MVIYTDYGKNPLGVDLTLAYSDEGYKIERDGITFDEAIDPTSEGRTYTETDIPVEDATIEDYQAALTELGVLNDETETE